MPSMANITVKNSSDEDVVFNAAVPSAGDRSAARWNVNDASLVAGFRPTITLSTRDNGSVNARVFEVNGAVPVMGTINGVETRLATVTIKSQATLPTNVSTAAVLDGYTILVNAMASALFKASAETGYAPT